MVEHDAGDVMRGRNGLELKSEAHSTGRDKPNSASEPLNNHSTLVNEILLKVGSRPDVRLSKNPVGVAKKGDRVIRYGVFGVGAADIIGIYRGRFLAIECKTGRAVLSKPQQAFRRMVLAFQGIYVEARCVGDVVVALEQVGAQPQP